ncbi:hypothetical protein GCM10010160_64920 [Acrocarpospora corrugata]
MGAEGLVAGDEVGHLGVVGGGVRFGVGEEGFYQGLPFVFGGFDGFGARGGAALGQLVALFGGEVGLVTR